MEFSRPMKSSKTARCFLLSAFQVAFQDLALNWWATLEIVLEFNENWFSPQGRKPWKEKSLHRQIFLLCQGETVFGGEQKISG